MKNNSEALNDMLFDQLRQISRRDLKGDAFKEEMERSVKYTMLAKQILNNAALQLKATLEIGNSLAEVEMPPMLRTEETKSQLLTVERKHG